MTSGEHLWDSARPTAPQRVALLLETLQDLGLANSDKGDGAAAAAAVGCRFASFHAASFVGCGGGGCCCRC